MISWIITHWDNILAVYGGVVIACTAFVKITPTTKDDEILGKIVKVAYFFSTAFTKADAKKLEKTK